MQNAILVPTDFSENACIAARYAKQLAINHGLGIQLLHVTSNMGKAMASSQFNAELDAYEQAKSQEKLDQWAANLQADTPSLSVTTACMQGNLCEVMLQLVEGNPINFIVMGATGNGGWKEKLIGSNTFEMIQKSPIGIISVPKHSHTFRLQKIGLLTNFKTHEQTLLNAFVARISTSIQIYLLHVWEQKKRPSDADISFWKNQLASNTNIQSISFCGTETTNRIDFKNPIPECITELCHDQDLDILLVSYSRKRFFNALFAKSLVKTLANSIQIPTYFLRTEQS